MRHTESHFLGTGGLELYRQTWSPVAEPDAVIALVHGVGEHSGRYMRVVDPLVKAGVAVCGYDQRGHGRSPGRPVYIDDWAQYRDDLHAFLGKLAEEFPDRPIVLYGHSMGSLVVLDYLLSHPEGTAAGAIISGVAIEPAGVGSPFTIALARLLTGVLPRMSIGLGIDAGSLTRDPEALDAYRADSLVSGRATVRWGTESLDAVVRIKDGMGGIDLPLLVIHGGDDPLNRVEGATALFEAATHPANTLRIYPDTLHEPHNDIAHAQVAADIEQWVALRLQSGAEKRG